MKGFAICFILVATFACETKKTKIDELKSAEVDVQNQSENEELIDLDSFKIQDEITITSSQTRIRDTIPENLRNYIVANLKDFSFIPIENYSEDWEIFYKEVDHYPNMVKADFNGDEVSDFGILLYNRNREINLVVFESTRDEEFEHFMVDNFGSRSRKHIIGLFIEGKGIVGGVDGSIELKNPSIIVIWFEKSSRIYYYDSAQYKKFSTSD